jgi:hypothetical protein
MFKPRQVRIQLTGGIGDLEAWAEDLAEIAEERGFVQHFQDGPTRFGDHGPLHKLTIGYIQKP